MASFKIRLLLITALLCRFSKGHTCTEGNVTFNCPPDDDPHDQLYCCPYDADKNETRCCTLQELLDLVGIQSDYSFNSSASNCPRPKIDKLEDVFQCGGKNGPLRCCDAAEFLKETIERINRTDSTTILMFAVLTILLVCYAISCSWT